MARPLRDFWFLMDVPVNHNLRALFNDEPNDESEKAVLQEYIRQGLYKYHKDVVDIMRKKTADWNEESIGRDPTIPEEERDLISGVVLSGHIKDPMRTEALQAQDKWILQVIDGRAAFSDRMLHLATGAGYMEGGKTVLAWAWAPRAGEIFSAEDGDGVKRYSMQGYAQRPNAEVNTDNALDRIVIEKPEGMASTHIDFAAKALRITKTNYGPTGSRLAGMLMVASGLANGMLSPMPDIYTLEIGRRIVEEAGGRVTDGFGNPPMPGSGIMVVSNGRIHQDLSDLAQTVRIYSPQDMPGGGRII
ncbi:hypothetical protein JXB02_05625 [Candidatus Woesearchaeota archaeon]|nr:hypothetical protein [Candidatus Woesearchaeota archaeon]